LNAEALTQATLVLGIDTGGTYTDGVLLDYGSRRVMASHKSLTTKRDFSIGIEAVIQGIRIKDPAAIQMVSISTTLATNAIAEGKRKPVALLLIGYDPELIASFHMQGRFGTPHYYYFDGGHDLHGREKAPLDLSAILATVSDIENDVDAVAVSSYFSPLNPEHESRACKAITCICDLPVVMGHQLSSKLGSVERATTAALNASLLAVLKEFIIAVRRAMVHRQIKAPLMVVRGDGTLMSDEFAVKTPVETIHSGPAASAIGGRFLSHLDEALVVDIGGTTTDIAVIEKGQVAVSEEGATVVEYKTAVKAANLFSIALGGDSYINSDSENQITIGPQRVTPLAYLADRYPGVESHLKALSQRSDAHLAPDMIECWYLLHTPVDTAGLQTKQEKELVDFLAGGPRPLPDILSHLNVYSKVQISTDNLLRREIIGLAGLTPTDLLHVDGFFSAWNTEAAEMANDIFCRCLRYEPIAFRQQIWSIMTLRIVRAIVTFLSGKELTLANRSQAADMGQWFFQNSLNGNHPQLETQIRLRQPIIGIGAPAAFFLKSVAEKLHCELILPTHYEVANAVGAVAGSVMITEEILVYPQIAKDGLEILGYMVQAGDHRQGFDEISEALTHARKIGRERAMGAALRSGADSPEVIVKAYTDGLDTYRIRANAMGKPRLMKFREV
jgi:N-methylhydantoinase A/oxoprolinase/acetone carboxylase beta subunit